MSAAAAVAAEPTVEQQQLQAEIATLRALISQQAELLARLMPKAASSITIGALFERYTLVRQRATNWSKIRHGLAPLVRRLGALPAAELSPMKWAEHVAARASEPTRRGSPPKVSMLNRELERARELLKWAVATEMLDRNPLAAAKPERVLEARETWLGSEDVQRLLDAAAEVHDRRKTALRRPDEWRGLMLRAFILVSVDTGMRRGETLQLHWDRIGADGVFELLARSTKSRRRRIVALTPRALQAIKDIPRPGRHTPTGGCGTQLRAPVGAWVFVNPETGERLSSRWFSRCFRMACEACGIDTKVAEGDVQLRIHDLRHTHASLADAKGASATAIRDALGHSNLGITQRYLHRNQARGAVELARLMDPASPTITVGEIYRRYAVHREHEPGWHLIRNRLAALVRDLGDLPAIDLTPAVWAEFVAKRSTEEAPPSAATIHVDLQRAKELLRWGVSAFLLKENPLREAPPHVRRGIGAKGEE